MAESPPSFQIVFVPGLRPKPRTNLHRDALLQCVLLGLRRVAPQAAEMLAADQERFALYPWTHAVYSEYRDFELDRAGLEALLANPEPTAGQLREIGALKRRLLRMAHLAGDAVPILGRMFASERQRMMLQEARDYLHDRNGMASRTRFGLRVLLEGLSQQSDRIIVIGHSLGSVIAYDSFWELSQSSKVTIDSFLTIGSPLATHFVGKFVLGADKIGRARYPSNIRTWENFSSRGELTALHPHISKRFSEMLELGLLESLQDHVGINNHFRGAGGLNVHAEYGYLINAQFARALAAALTRGSD